MNIKHFILAALAVFVFISLFDGVVHSVVLSPLYAASAKVWRGNMDSSTSMMVWMTIYHAVFAVWTTFLFARLFSGGGLRTGAQFGWMIGMFIGFVSGASAIWLDVSPNLGIAWFFAATFAGIGYGMLLGLIYRPAVQPNPA